ncbi:MAG: dTDP-4-amino-4,6-dideoxygalactose transaminase [Acidobacteria bacterium]|nr:dTDP-4-amino-4,6-dideoxygalactose transaminase [Acidobacteriota bacterium]
MPATSTTYAIPLHRPPFEDADAHAVVAALNDGLLTGDGAANQRLAQAAQRTLGCHRAYATPSGTHALELMMRALPLAPGDEVICPSFTFVSVANAIILAGGTPVFADIEAATLNLDPASVQQRLSPRTRAIVTGHYGGIAFGLETLESLASSRGIALLEDAAHALGGTYRGRALGTWGRAAAFSFHGTKNLVAGEGGLFVTTDAALAARAEIIREKGTDRSRFLRGDVDRYTWQAVGSSYLMSDVLAALVLAQWGRIDAITAARRERFDRYQQALAPLAAAGQVTRPIVPEGCEPAYHVYFVLADAKATRDRLAAWLRERGIEASSHFVPLHLSPYATNTLGTRPGLCPITESAADRLVRLPLYPALSPADQQTVIDAVSAFFGRSRT